MSNAHDRVDEIAELFEQNDTDGNGDIDFGEFEALVSELDPRMSKASLEIGFRETDINKDGRINFDEFLDWWLTD
jgi:calmodulin